LRTQNRPSRKYRCKRCLAGQREGRTEKKKGGEATSRGGKKAGELQGRGGKRRLSSTQLCGMERKQNHGGENGKAVELLGKKTLARVGRKKRKGECYLWKVK